MTFFKLTDCYKTSDIYINHNNSYVNYVINVANYIVTIECIFKVRYNEIK